MGMTGSGSCYLRTFLRKKLHIHTTPSLLHALSFHRAFSSRVLKRSKQQTNLFDGALRVLDVISPKRSTFEDRQNHLRLIQDFLQMDSDHDGVERLDNLFASSSTGFGVSDVFDEILQSYATEEEECGAECWRLDAGFLSNAVSSCSSARNIRGGIQYHCLAIRSGFVANAYVGSSLITFYSKCGQLGNAYKVFGEMPVRNVVAWTAIISGFAHDFQVDVCLELYSFMRNSTLKPNDFTLSSLLSACTGSGALGQGRSAHCQIIQMGFDSHLQIANALISMYCKCGSVDDALFVFENMDCKDVVSWNSMISGYAQHGLAIQAIELFEMMKKEGEKPDAISFLNVLSSCRHAGFVEEGRNYFNSMVEYGVKPELDHYSCLVDLLGRAGLLDDARAVIERMPIPANAVIWGSLLASSRLHGTIWIGIEAAESKLLLEPECSATLVQLANLYASARCWDQAARVRKLMKDRGLKTHPGFSWIEIKNVVYKFRAEDRSNYRCTEILAVLDVLVYHMITVGYVPEIHEGVNDAL